MSGIAELLENTFGEVHPALAAVAILVGVTLLALIVVHLTLLARATLRQLGDATIPVGGDRELRAALKNAGFRRLRALEGGGIASVYFSVRRAQSNLDHDVSGICAVKVLKRAFRKDGEVFRKFLHEGAILRRIEQRAQRRHPDRPIPVVRCIDSGIMFSGEEQIPFLQLEWIGGKGLDELLVNGQRLDWKRSLRVAVSVAEGLALAHADKILHRDVSPPNIMFMDRACTQVRLIDFGVAKLEHLETQPGHMWGKPLYMAPELFQEGGGASEASEIWALGIVLFEMLAGRAPFGSKGDDYARIIREIQTKPLPEIPVVDVPDPLRELVRTMLTKDATERQPRRMSEFIQNASAVVAGAGVA